jgi:hypothetical protein
VPHITLDRTRLIAFMRISGFFDMDRVLRTSARMDEAVLAFGERIPWHGRLIDLSEARVASPDTIKALRAEIADPRRSRVWANRVAYFGASPLLKQQIRRLCDLRPTMAVFDDRRAAHAWASGGSPPVARHGDRLIVA